MALNGDKTKLKEADINKVDFVPAGAQQHSRISLFKSNDENGLLNRIVKAIGGVFASSEDIAPTTFVDELVEMKEQKVINEMMCGMWDYFYALQDSIRSIVLSNVPNKHELIQGSVDQFTATVVSEFSDNTVSKIGKKISTERMASLKACMKQLAELISDAEAEPAVAHTEPDGTVAQPVTQSASVPLESEPTEPAEPTKDGKPTEPVEPTRDGKSVEPAEPDVKVEKPNNKKPDKANDNEGSGKKMAEINKSALPQDVQDYITSLEAQIAKSAPPVGEDIYKGLPEGVVTILKAQELQLKASNELIAKMRDESIEKEFVAKAATMTDKLGVDSSKFGKVLKSIHAANPELATEVENVIKAANEAVGKGNLFTEVGAENHGVGVTGVAKADAWTQIETLASGMVTKGDSKTQAEAIDAVLKTAEGRRLYEVYTGKIKG